jgi:hypothetical protein
VFSDKCSYLDPCAEHADGASFGKVGPHLVRGVAGLENSTRALVTEAGRATGPDGLCCSGGWSR